VVCTYGDTADIAQTQSVQQTAHLMNDFSLLVSDSTSLVHIESAHLQAEKTLDQI